MQGLIGASADLLEEDSHPPNVASNSNWYSEAAHRQGVKKVTEIPLTPACGG